VRHLRAPKCCSKRRNPLQRVLEESVFERCLKRAGLGLDDSKSGTDFELRRAINFHVSPAALLEGSAHRVYGQCGRVAIAAEMAKYDALDFPGQQFLDHACRSRVRQMSVPRLDALFHRPRPVRVVLQKFFVVIRFDHERLHFSQAFDDQLGHVTEVSDKPKAA